MTNRIAELNAPKKASRKPATKKVVKSDDLHTYAVAGVGVMAILSALLNGYANAQHASIAWAGWGMGLVIPAIILILGKVASLLYKRGYRRGSIITGLVGIGLLFLSVWHCASSIAELTGSHLWLALPMAVAIDCGFVCCEVASLID
jgi:cell division protein FtsW (lipid II flippase)